MSDGLAQRQEVWTPGLQDLQQSSDFRQYHCQGGSQADLGPLSDHIGLSNNSTVSSPHVIHTLEAATHMAPTAASVLAAEE